LNPDLENSLEIKLHNWRCFVSSSFVLPDKSLIIIGDNGSGKTSLLSGIYSLYTKKPWPRTKLISHLRNNTQYFGISSQFSNWSFNGKLGSSGKLVTKYDRPSIYPFKFNSNKLEDCLKSYNLDYTDKLSDLKPVLKKDISSSFQKSWPKILTYSPEDNYWLSFSRSQKLAYFDDFLKELFDKKFKQTLKKLDQNVLAKQKLIKKKVQENCSIDTSLLTSLNKEILESSITVWHYRWFFIKKIKTEIHKFSSWIRSPLKNWKLDWEVLDLTGKPEKLEDLDTFLKKILDQSSQSFYWQELWKKELILQKNLFGATRDNFYFESNHTLASQSLSRGENRLLILFIKKLLQDAILEQDKNALIWWFLDDVFNEFDLEKEALVKEEILTTSHKFLITATKKPNFDVLEFKI
jgi:recombinational DNA repair ATPase RecF